MQKRSLISRIENSRLAAVAILVVVVAVIIGAFFVFYQIHKDDPNLGVTLYYRYNPGTSTSDPSVRVWGDVYNWGDGPGKGTLKIVIADDERHTSTYSISLGIIPSGRGVVVDETYPWDYQYDPIEHPQAPVTVTYEISSHRA